MQHLLFRNNPMIYRLRRETPRPPVQTLFWIGFWAALGLGIVGYALLKLGYLGLLEMGWVLAWLLTLSLPILIAMTAAIRTVRDMDTGQYEILFVTTMPDHVLVWCYVLSALYQSRYLIMVLVALMPFHVTATFFHLIKVNAEFALQSPYIVPTAPTRFEIILPTLVFLGLTVGMWAMPLLSAVIGVAVALHWHDIIAASSLAFLFSALTGLLLTFPVWLAVAFPQAIQILITLCAPTMFIGMFIVIWEYTFQQATRVVRRPAP